MDASLPFPHRQSAHCESGVTANLLRFHQIECSEALAFGIGEGLFFGYLPFIKINGLPLTTFRGNVGSIFSKVNKRLGVTVRRRKFRSEKEAMQALDAKLAEGVPVGCQTGAFWLPYFPPAFRFHFNMHNLVVFGRQGDEYLISDPVFETVVRCKSEDLQRARYAKGAMAPQGAMYYLETVPQAPDMAAAAWQGLVRVCTTMLRVPIPLFGVKGISFLADRLEKWPKKLGEKKALLYLGHLIRMQEEIGTGGGGFRFMYAAFLQEAAELLHLEQLFAVAERMTLIGDTWREFAVSGARMCKERGKASDTYENLADILRQCGQSERAIYTDILRLCNDRKRGVR
jgi:hypothetical protein